MKKYKIADKGRFICACTMILLAVVEVVAYAQCVILDSML